MVTRTSENIKANSAILTGRRKIYTDVRKITKSNINSVIQQAMIDHEINRNEMIRLYKYEAGDQPVFYRKKLIRPEVNVHANANYARQIKDFKVGYEFGAPITFVQRAKDDFSKKDPKQDDKRVAALNQMFFEERKQSKDVKLATDFKTCGVGYMMAYPKKEDGRISPFDLLVLNPLNTFVIYTNDAYQRKIAACTYTVLETGVKRMTVYTDDFIYEGTSSNPSKTIIPNTIGVVPIVEFINNYSRMACFEAVIPLIDALNITNSDRVNDVVQYVQSILWLHNAKVDDSQQEKLRAGGFIQTKSTADGKDAKIAYVTAPLNQSETQTLVDYMYKQILDISGVPGTEASSGGNTGSAILLSNGWQIAETQAKSMELLFFDSEMELLDVVLRIINKTPDIPDDAKGIKLYDVMPKSSRNKTYDLVSRTAALSNLVNMGIDLGHALSVVDIFDDSQQVALDSMETVMKLLLKKTEPASQEKQETDSGDGNVIGGAKSAEDYNAEASKEKTGDENG